MMGKARAGPEHTQASGGHGEKVDRDQVPDMVGEERVHLIPGFERDNFPPYLLAAGRRRRVACQSGFGGVAPGPERKRAATACSFSGLIGFSRYASNPAAEAFMYVSS
jgi:hypothetical protein